MRIPARTSERRRSVRITEPFLFNIGHRGYDIQAITINISCHGAMCVVDRDIPMMSQLNIGLELPTGTAGKRKTVHMKGVLVRKDKDPRTGRFLVAVYFSDVKSADQKMLERFIDRYLKTS